jgi:hypothetical protein
MDIRTITWLTASLDSAAWLFVASATFFSGSDPSTKWLDTGAGIAVTALFLVTAVPSLILFFLKRAPKTALALALTFPAAFVVLFGAAVIYFAA